MIKNPFSWVSHAVRSIQPDASYNIAILTEYLKIFQMPSRAEKLEHIKKEKDREVESGGL